MLHVLISNGDKEIIAVALLGEGAQSSLGTEDFFNKLGINERPSNLKLATVTGELTEYKSMSASITVKPLDCSHSVAMEYVRSIQKLTVLSFGAHIPYVSNLGNEINLVSLKNGAIAGRFGAFSFFTF